YHAIVHFSSTIATTTSLAPPHSPVTKILKDHTVKQNNTSLPYTQRMRHSTRSMLSTVDRPTVNTFIVSLLKRTHSLQNSKAYFLAVCHTHTQGQNRTSKGHMSPSEQTGM